MDTEIPEEITELHWKACGLECPVLTGGTCKRDQNEFCTLYKFDTAAAEIAYAWTLDSGQDEECGNSTDGDAWYALFRDDRVIVQEVSGGSVYAWQVEPGEDIDAKWAEIEKNAWQDPYGPDADEDPDDEPKEL